MAYGTRKFNAKIHKGSPIIVILSRINPFPRISSRLGILYACNSVGTQDYDHLLKGAALSSDILVGKYGEASSEIMTV